MRSPISDENAGAATQVAPTKKHAVRTATIARQGRNQASEKLQQLNKVSSQLGEALGTFMTEQRTIKQKQQYAKAYHEQGMKTGLSEYQKDLKRTGFTEFIYGGQSPEYQGALDAAARNASNSMFIEESEFIEETGGDLTPAEYQTHLEDKLTQYNLDNFTDTPDAAVAFMANWQENSNALTKQHVKLFAVRQQEKARRTVAEGWQTDLDKYKSLISSDPNAAEQLGKDMFSGKYKPTDMSDTAYREMLISEAFTAARAHDFSALKLLNESGLVGTFNDKELKEYSAVRSIIDEDNFNSMEAGRLAYETVIENPLSTPQEVEAASQQFDSLILQVSARNTGSSKHLKTAFGADRHRGVLGNQYRTRLEEEAEERLEERVGEVEYNSDIFDALLMQAEPADRRTMLADRLDDLVLAMNDPTIAREVRADLAKQIVAGTTKLEKWESADAKRRKDAKAKQDEVARKEKELRVGVQSLQTGGGYYTANSKDKKTHLAGAVSGTANQVLPDTSIPTVDKLEMIFSNPMHTKQFMQASSKYGGYIVDSPEVTTAISNLGVQLKATNESNVYTTAQKQQANALSVLRLQNPALFNASFPTAKERMEIQAITNAIGTGKGIVETNNTLAKLEQNIDRPTAMKLSGDNFLEAMGLSGSPADVQDLALQEYKNLLPLGSDEALKGAKAYMANINPVVNGKTITYGGTFGKIGDAGLDEVLKTMSISYRSGNVWKSGLTEPLQRLLKNDTTKAGTTLYSLKQVPDVKLSVYQGNLVLELNGRRQVISRDAMEIELDGYKQRAGGNTNKRR